MNVMKNNHLEAIPVVSGKRQEDSDVPSLYNYYMIYMLILTKYVIRLQQRRRGI